jgi:hypothetical protein
MLEKKYIVWKEREDQMVRGKEDEIVEECLGDWGERRKEGEDQRTVLREYLGDPSVKSEQRKIRCEI